MFVSSIKCVKFAPALELLAYGVIGNTPVFGTDIQGSSPCRPTLNPYNHLIIRVLCFYTFFCVGNCVGFLCFVLP